MNSIWSESFVAFVLTTLAGAGIAAIGYGVRYFWITKTGGKRKMEENEVITIIVLAFTVGIVCSGFLINQLVSDANDVFSSNQHFNCWNSKTADGKDLTEAQCEYFVDVLNGKYVDRAAIETIEDGKYIEDNSLCCIENGENSGGK